MNVVIAIALTFALIGALQWAIDFRLAGLPILGVYLVLYWIVAWVRKPAQPAEFANEPDPDYSHWPVSGPIGRFGRAGLLVPWILTNVLSFLNPFQFVQIVQQLIGNSGLAARERATGDDGRGYRTSVSYTLPFRGEWLLYNGGMTPKTSHSWGVLGQRFALDFVKADDSLRRHSGKGTRVEEYFCYGEAIVAAADGEVVAIQDGISTAPLLGWGVCDFMALSFVGNHVIIKHAVGEFALYAHLIAGSVAVRPGQAVVRGQVIGRCGHTGHSSEPHLHFHLQDSADLFRGMGLPVRFSNAVVDGTLINEAALVAGNRVQQDVHNEEQV